MQQKILSGIIFIIFAASVIAAPKNDTRSAAPKKIPDLAGLCEKTLKPGRYNFKVFRLVIPKGWTGSYHPASGGAWSVELRGPRKGQLVLANGFEKASMKAPKPADFVSQLRSELLPGAKKSFEVKSTVGGKPGLKIEAVCRVGDTPVMLRRLISDRPKMVYVLDQTTKKEDWSVSQKDLSAIAAGFRILQE